MSDDHDRQHPGNEQRPTGGDETSSDQTPGDQEQPVCAMCGNPISPDDVVCPSCGTSLAAG